MHILRLYWVGIRTARHNETVAFFHEVMGLPVRHSEQDFTVLAVPDGLTVEVFGPTSPDNQHITCPVAGARRLLVRAQPGMVGSGMAVIGDPDGNRIGRGLS